MSEKIHRKDIQKGIYDSLGVTPDMVIPTYRDDIDVWFTMNEVNSMDDDELNYYFDMGNSIDRSGNVDENKGWIEKSIEVNSLDNLMDFIKPKSSFKDFEKKVSDMVDKHLKSNE